MSTHIPFGTQLVGRTEKTLTAILTQLLSGTGVGEPEWVALSVARAAGPIPTDALVARVAGVLRTSEQDARTRLAELAAQGLVSSPVAGTDVELTAAGQELHGRVRRDVDAVTERLWGDLPSEQLDAAGRVLNVVLQRAGTELAAL